VVSNMWPSHVFGIRWESRRGWGRELATNGSNSRRAPPRRRAQPLQRSKVNHGAGERAGPRVSTWWVSDGEGSVVGETNERRRRR